MTRSLRSWLSFGLSGLVVLPLVAVVALTSLLLLPRVVTTVEAENRVLSHSITERIESLLLSTAEETRKLSVQLAELPRGGPREALIINTYADNEEDVRAVYILDSELRVSQVGLPRQHRRKRNDFIGIDFSGHAFVKKAQASGKTVWSDAHLSLHGMRVVAVATPVNNRIFVTEIGLMHLSGFVKRLGEQSDALAVILDKNLHLAAHPDQGRSMQQEEWQNNPLFRLGQKAKVVTGEIMIDGAEYIGTAARIPQLGWVSLVAKSKGAAYAVFYDFSYWLSAVLSFVLILVLLVALGAARFMSTRLESFGRQLGAIADGDYFRRLPRFKVKELNKLSDHVKQMATKVLEREAKYREVIENSTNLICRIDTDAKITFVNHLSSRYYGLPPRQCVGLSAFEFVHPDDLENAKREFRLGLESGEHVDHLEYRVLSRSGEIFQLLWRVVAISDEQNNVIGFAGIASDVTEERRAQAKLKLAASVFESSAFGIFITDADTNIISVNPAMTSITGFIEKEMLGNKPSMFSSGVHGPEFYREMWQELTSRGIWRGEIWNSKRNADVYPVALTIKVVEDAGGNVVNYIGTCIDITEQKKAEEQIQFLAHHDVLTGLPNRILLDDRMQYAFAQSKRAKMRAAVMFLDLDRFKPINDTLGHDVGDMLLQAVAANLKAALRETDTVARIGGDEFVVVAPEIEGEEQASLIAQKIINALATPQMIDGHELQVGTSIGISFYPDHGETAEDLLHKADVAMYASKMTQGRNIYQFFLPEMEGKARAET